MESQTIKEFLQNLTAGLVDALNSVTSALKSVEKGLDRAYQRTLLEDRLRTSNNRKKFNKQSRNVPTVRNCNVHPQIGDRDQTRRCWGCNSKYHLIRNCPVKINKKWMAPTPKSTSEQIKNRDKHGIALKNQHHALSNMNGKTKEGTQVHSTSSEHISENKDKYTAIKRENSDKYTNTSHSDVDTEGTNHTGEGDRNNEQLCPNRKKKKKEKLNRQVDVNNNKNNFGVMAKMESHKITPTVNSITKDSPKTVRAKVNTTPSDSDYREIKEYVPLMERKIAMLRVAMKESIENAGSTNDYGSSSELTRGQPVLPTRKHDTPPNSDYEDSFKGLWFKCLFTQQIPSRKT